LDGEKTFKNGVKMTENVLVQDGQVISMEYTLRVDGAILDASGPDQPLEFIQGQGQIIPGLEAMLYGMGVGESKQVVVAPADGYGELDSAAYADIPRAQVPPHIPLEVGLELQVRGQDGQAHQARITQVSDEAIRLDFNHPLAGKELHFDVKIAALRAATSEELDHGHVH
jgi:FKBP-type peptidyl-prolyl cis-trans isomerase SlyD